jgi:hypothetical protein
MTRRTNSEGFSRADWVSLGVTALLTLAVYVITLAPQVTLGFSGIFSVGAMYLGVPHTPGYPLATLYQWLFVKLFPFGNIAWRVALSSAMAGALACGLIALMVSRTGGALTENLPPRQAAWLRTVAGYAAGMIFAVNGAFWNRAVVADVWPFTVLLLCIVLSLLMQCLFSPERRRSLYGACFVYGLGVTNSQMLLAAAPAIVLAILLHDRSVRTITICAGSFIAGLIPYFLVPIFSMTNPPINWGYGRTVAGFFHLLERGHYDRIQPTSDVSTFLNQLRVYAEITGREFGWPYLIFALLPLLLFWRRPARERRWMVALVAFYLGLTLLVVLVLNPVDHKAGREDIKVFFSLSYVPLAIWVGYGLLWLARSQSHDDIPSMNDALPRRFSASSGGEGTQSGSNQRSSAKAT